MDEKYQDSYIGPVPPSPEQNIHQDPFANWSSWVSFLVSRDGERFQQTHFLPAALESWHWFHSWDLLIEIWLGSFLCYPWTGSWTSIQNKGQERACSTTVFWGRSWWKSSVGSRKPGWGLELAAMGYPWTSNLISFRFSTYKLNIIFLTIENCDEK